MIVPMKKATILFEAGDAESTANILRRMGVLHIEHHNPPDGRDIPLLQEKVALIDTLLGLQDQVIAEGGNIPPQEAVNGDWSEVAERIIGLGKHREQLDSFSRTILSQIHEWERWGDIDPVRIRQLGEKDIFLRLFQVPANELGKFPLDVVVRTIFTVGGIAHCVAISRREFDCGFPELLPPKESLSSLNLRLAETRRDLERIDREIFESARFREFFFKIRRSLEKEIELRQVLNGMGREGGIGYVSGYIPFDLEGPVVAEARQRRWGIMVTEPTDLDDVPTLIRNPEWVSLIRPVLGLLGLTPGYRELDVSTLFLIFFSLFFGILIGDAGYGFAYLLITLVLQKIVLPRMNRESPEMKTTISLFYLLGACALVWGLLTGTFFGQTWFLEFGYKPLVPQLNDSNTMQAFCFFLGALHLSIAHSWRAYLQLPSVKALADIGWICVLWTAYFLANTLVLGDAFPPFGIWLIGAGVALVILFSSPQKNILRGIGNGLGTVALSIMNNFTDVISYVRLFAVGLATLAIAETTNTLAFGFGEGIVALAAGVAILIIGHGLNIILGPMSVLVHGVRLNVLEFSGHANVTWSGTAFKPLKEE